MKEEKAILALADGSCFTGKSIGALGETSGEIVFNTSITGYQEILTDPSYNKQIVTLTYPHIGNTGTNLEDMESPKIWSSGLVIRDLPSKKSNWRAENSLDEFLKSFNTVGISDIDTRKLTRIIRVKGSQSAAIIAGKNCSEKRAIELAKGFPGLLGMDLTKEVTISKKHLWKGDNNRTKERLKKFKVSAIDIGVKRNI